MKTKMVTGDCCKINLIAGKAASRDGKKTVRTSVVCWGFLVSVLIVLWTPAFCQDDPNEFNEVMGLSFLSAGTASGSCGWEIVAERDGSWEQGSDGGQLTIRLNTCKIFQYQIKRFPQSGGASGTADLNADDLIIVWDEDAGHGSEEQHKNFSYTGTYAVIEPADYSDYLELTTTDPYTNWAVYRAVTPGTFTKGGEGTNEHEILNLQYNIMSFIKDDGIPENECVSPWQEMTYTICFDNAFGRLVTDPYIIDFLPNGVDFPGAMYTIEFGDPNDPNQPMFNLIPPDPGYDKDTHSYVWPLYDIDPNTGGCVQLKVIVNDQAVPGGILHNIAELWGTFLDPNGLPVTGLLARATIDTRVCCYGDSPEILYVDKTATGSNTGMDWPNALIDLQHALAYARSAPCGQVHSIFVAQETYYPGENATDSFVLPDGISVYGGFPKGGSAFDQRNPRRYQAVLSGKINDTQRNTTVLVAGNNTYIDGFTITESALDGQGIYAADVDFTVANSIVVKNLGYGAFTENCNAVFQWVNFRNNEADGIRHTGEGKMLYLENVWVRQSGQYGIICEHSTPVIVNSVITESDLALEGRAGLMMVNAPQRPYIQNVTVSHNKTRGIWRAGGALPEIYNSIIFHNGGPALAGFSADQAAMYSCIEDANSVNFNTSLDPEFLYFDPNNVRISPDSPCRYLSNQSPEFMALYETQLDMDGRPRKSGYAVDAGAYEIACDMDVSSPYDLNADGLINLEEFARFSRFFGAHDPNDTALTDPNNFDYDYRTDPNSPGYVTSEQTALWYPDGHKFNFATQGLSAHAIDLADLLAFLEDAPWLWKACWVDLEEMQMQQMMSAGESMQTFAMSEITSEPPVIQQKSVQEQMVDLATAILFLEQIWLEDPLIQQEIDAQAWQGFMDAVYQNLMELQAVTVQLE